MARQHDAHMTGLWVAQEARKREGWTTDCAKTAAAVDTTSGGNGNKAASQSHARLGAPSQGESAEYLAPLTHQRTKADTVGAGSPRVPPDAASSPPLYALVMLCRANKLPEPMPEYRFHPSRKWRFDYAWPRHMLALEIEGGVWTQGRHTRGAGAVADMEKYSEAAIMGWRLLYVTPQQVQSVAIDYLRRALNPQPAAA